MATRRKRDADIASDVARGFAVVVEEMRGQFHVFGEKLSSLDEKFDALDAKVTSLDEKFTGKIDALDAKFTGKIDALDAKFTGKIGALDAKFTGKFDALDAKFTGKFDALDAKVTSIDLRLERVEHDVEGIKDAVLQTREELKKKVDRDEVEAIAERVVIRLTR